LTNSARRPFCSLLDPENQLSWNGIKVDSAPVVVLLTFSIRYDELVPPMKSSHRNEPMDVPVYLLEVR
jgi:hypothetical protein